MNVADVLPEPLTDRALLRAFFAYPLMTLKVTAAIYWHGFRLWRKRLPILPHRRKMSGSRKIQA